LPCAGVVTRGLRDHKEARKYFFFEKKKQKTFALLVDAARTIDTHRNE